ncbi:cell division protein FtsZ [Desulfovibrio litoralis]|uniref:Cell division protein FtsZ n=1 Tax=Desulfovibrio litoralis DSM 11393 TaxID=1121455 RepID=A0A1M7SLR5_9BACT|nr:cell division protein FtsZ [Desulfovibrio litoralis]SHN59405.1 cell division protein FtsZ [Desulfovibrio litoralis DSM 11393]
MLITDIYADPPAKIKVIGVGGAGGNAVNNMIMSNLSGVTFIAANTDVQALGVSQASIKIQLGEKLTKGLGAGAIPQVGCDAALESLDQIKAAIGDADLVFVTAGMGGGTGTGAAPVIAKAAKEMGALTVGVVTKPFSFEGKRRLNSAVNGIADFRQHVDSIITIPNDRLVQLAHKKATFAEMLRKADEVLYHAVKGISDVIIVPGLINLDFNDVKTVMSESGLAMMGSGLASGEGRGREAAMRAITSPLLEDVSIDGARGVLINLTSSSDVGMEEVAEASNVIQEAAHEDANIIFGTALDDEMGDAIRVTVIATGLSNSAFEAVSAKAASIQNTVVSPMNPNPTTRINPTHNQHNNAGYQQQNTYNQQQGYNRSPSPVETHLGAGYSYDPSRKQHFLGNLSEEERNQPSFLRNPVNKNSAVHTPGDISFSFDDDDTYGTPSFMRKQAN